VLNLAIYINEKFESKKSIFLMFSIFDNSCNYLVWVMKWRLNVLN